MSNWTNIDAGPRMVKMTNEALGRIKGEHNTFVRVTGTVGKPETEHRSTLQQFSFGANRLVRADVDAALEAIGNEFGWEVTKANYKAIIAAAEAAWPELVRNRPIHDERITQQEEDERTARTLQRNSAETAKRNAEQALMDEAMAKCPTGAKALIVAELKKDNSDPLSDYFANTTVRCVAIGWRFGAREDFRQLRAAADAFPETKHLGHTASNEIERRDNYSMGSGNYLSDHGWDGSGSGWVVRSRTIPASYLHLTEVCLPETTSAPLAVVSGVTIRPSSIGREGVVEVIFDAKPEPEVIGQLKAHGFRWARGNRCWYGRDVTFAETLQLKGNLAAASERLTDS